MWQKWIPFWRPGVSSYGGNVDLLFIGLVVMSLAVTGLLLILLLGFAVRYRVGSNADRGHRIRKSWHWEVGWTTGTFVGFILLFIWGASLYLQIYGAGPSGMLPIYIVAKQWMWKAQHPGGQREINELHVPVRRPVRLIMASQDAIHSFFVPAFRVKHDVVPGRYQDLWFQAEKVGVFQLLCAEFCGTDHSRMTGRIVVLEPTAYEEWLARQDVTGTLASEGADLFRQLGCSGCHLGRGTVRAPALEGLYGKPVPLQDGTFAVADERYIRDAILRPRAQVPAGYTPLMPSFAGRISEDELVRIVAYIKSLAERPVP
ncbi:MAG: cytochrome c oxidase subunit II [Blastocatellia bacterium]|nr:MAG: cytochrome c oxidase subunit II [Blastocatellia bacterium]